MFRDRRQRAAVCTALCRLAGLNLDAATWPTTKRAMRPPETLHAAAEGEGARVLLAAAWALWTGSGGPPLGDLVKLDGDRLAALGSLLVAVARGPAAVDGWLVEAAPAVDLHAEGFPEWVEDVLREVEIPPEDLAAIDAAFAALALDAPELDPGTCPLCGRTDDGGEAHRHSRGGGGGG